jgi:hypothetical protein
MESPRKRRTRKISFWVKLYVYLFPTNKLKMRLNSFKKSSTKILVLNSDYLPVNVTTFKKAFKLIYKGKAEIIEDEGETIITFKKKYLNPSVIRLIRYVNIPYRKVILSRENIFKRDNNTCTYCGINKNLTVDHIIPKSKGGKNVWENLITSCFVCNSKKGDKTLEQVNMKPMFNPFKPHPLFFICNSHRDTLKWKQYLLF